MVKNSVLDNISQQMIERYSSRFNQMGYDVKTLGWGSSEQQEHRFREAVSGVKFKEKKSVLDIGCGFGDLLALLIAEKKEVAKYFGWDINPDLIGKASEIWTNAVIPNKFDVKNIAESTNMHPIADIGFMFGVLNLNLKDSFDNYEYSKLFIKNAFNSVKELLVVDFLSTKLTPEYPKEDFVFYHNPLTMLEFAFSLTPNVVLKHNYAPIPQREFMLFLYK